MRDILISLVVMLAPAAPSLGAQPAKCGLELDGKAVTGTANANGTGLLGGLRGTRRLGTTGFAGLAGYGGPMVGRATGQGGMGFGGAFLGVKTRTEGGADLELSLLAGGGGGSGSPDSEGGGFAVHPELRAFFDAGGGRALSFAAGYLLFPRSRSLSGITISIGLSLDRRLAGQRRREARNPD